MTYINRDQVEQLLRPIHSSRVSVRDGLSHLEAYDVRAHLNRIFGFGRWSADLTDLTQLYETETQTKAGKAAFAVGYRATLKLTVCAPDGTVLATYTEAATGDAVMPDFKRGDAHDFAIKTAESQALKRCAINLGDQFGLSLYQKGSRDALVKRTLVMPDGTVPEVAVDHDIAPVTPDGAPADDPSETSTAPKQAVESEAATSVPPPDADVAALRARVMDAMDLPRQDCIVALGELKLEASKQRVLNAMTTSPAGEPMTVNVFIDKALLNATKKAA